MDTESLIVHAKKMIFIKTLQKMLKQFDTSNFELDRPLPKAKNKKVISLIKDKLSGKIRK